MSLANLSKIGRLTAHETDAAQVSRMLAAARRGITDASQTSISSETRLDAAYRAIIQMAIVALWANGYRPARNVPGHHATMIQSLTHSIELRNTEMLLLDTFRVKRNAVDYTGEDIDEGSVEACIETSKQLLQRLQAWLTSNRPDLLA